MTAPIQREAACPRCGGLNGSHGSVHERYGNGGGLLHATTSDVGASREPCRLGYEEHDGSRYCFEHGGFAHYLMYRTLICDRAREGKDRP